MIRLPRRFALIGAGIALIRPARALEEVEAATMLGLQDAAAYLKRTSGRVAIAKWHDDLWASCLATEDDRVVSAAIIQEDPATGAKRIVAGPVDAEVLTIDPFWTLDLSIGPLQPLGPGVPAFGLTVSNSYLSTGRSTGSESLSIFLRDGPTLRQVFRGYVQASSSEDVPCRHPRADGVPCRSGWSHQWAIRVAGPSVGGRPPPLAVIAKPSGRVVSRPVWRGDRYRPDQFDAM